MEKNKQDELMKKQQEEMAEMMSSGGTGLLEVAVGSALADTKELKTEK